MKGIKKLEFSVNSQSTDLFLIDWLTVTSKRDSVDSLKSLLGLERSDIPWVDSVKFINGYPCQCTWNGISIWYGADQEEFYRDSPGKSAADKVRYDMGICLNLSGTGCRAFESYGLGDWFSLLSVLMSSDDYHITRLDLAFDDHSKILDIYRLAGDVRDRYYTSSAKYAEVIWSDKQIDDIQGLNIQIGSSASDVLIRIYDKAAERGYNDDRHWVRCELQLRRDRAGVAVAEILKLRDVGRTVAGILRNYLLFRVPSCDSNKSRWPVADYWETVLINMEKISLWVTPGEEYNYSNTENWLVHQCGQSLLTAMKLGRLPSLLRSIEKLNPELAPKYQRVLDEYALRRAAALEQRRIEECWLNGDVDQLSMLD